MSHHRRSALPAAGLLLLLAAAVSAEAAWLHMRTLAATYGAICGSGGLAHCPACPAAVALLGAGLACLALAAAQRVRRPVRLTR